MQQPGVVVGGGGAVMVSTPFPPVAQPYAPQPFVTQPPPAAQQASTSRWMERIMQSAGVMAFVNSCFALLSLFTPLYVGRTDEVNSSWSTLSYRHLYYNFCSHTQTTEEVESRTCTHITMQGLRNARTLNVDTLNASFVFGLFTLFLCLLTFLVFIGRRRQWALVMKIPQHRYLVALIILHVASTFTVMVSFSAFAGVVNDSPLSSMSSAWHTMYGGGFALLLLIFITNLFYISFFVYLLMHPAALGGSVLTAAPQPGMAYPPPPVMSSYPPQPAYAPQPQPQAQPGYGNLPPAYGYPASPPQPAPYAYPPPVAYPAPYAAGGADGAKQVDPVNLDGVPPS